MLQRVKLFVFVSLLPILILTLFPFDFALIDDFSIRQLIKGFDNSSNSLDFIVNILLFVPFGYAMARLLKLKGSSKIKLLLVNLIICLSLSVVIEVLQLFLPHRFSTRSDVIANSLGGFLGYLNFLLFDYCLFISPQRQKIFLQPKYLMRCLLSYLVVVISLTISLSHSTELSNWSLDFPLVLGNEATGDRPWQGSIEQLTVFDRALSNAKIQQFFTEQKPTAPLNNSLIASYQLSTENNLKDSVGKLPPLIVQGNFSVKNKKNNSRGINLSNSYWLKTQDSPDILTSRISKTSQFTIYTIIATNQLKQEGPARIISVSQDINHRNFTLGQQNQSLVFRLRNSLMGTNGANFQLLIPDVFVDSSVHRLVISYHKSKITIYVDSLNQSYSWRLIPEAAIFKNFFALNSNYQSMLNYKFIYYLVVFSPLGLILGLLSIAIKDKLSNYLGFFVIAMIIITGILQSILLYGSRANFNLNNYLIGTAIAITTFFLVRSEITFQNFLRQKST